MNDSCVPHGPRGGRISYGNSGPKFTGSLHSGEAHCPRMNRRRPRYLTLDMVHGSRNLFALSCWVSWWNVADCGGNGVTKPSAAQKNTVCGLAALQACLHLLIGPVSPWPMAVWALASTSPSLSIQYGCPSSRRNRLMQAWDLRRSATLTSRRYVDGSLERAPVVSGSLLVSWVGSCYYWRCITVVPLGCSSPRLIDAQAVVY